MLSHSTITGVTEPLVAKHFDPFLGEGLHEHTWLVTAFYSSKPLRDGRALKASLRALLDALPDVTGELPSALWSGEALAEQVTYLLADCIGCRVTRPEGFEAQFWL